MFCDHEQSEMLCKGIIDIEYEDQAEILYEERCAICGKKLGEEVHTFVYKERS